MLYSIVFYSILFYSSTLCLVAGATQALGAVNKAMDPASMMKTMNQFALENDKMEVAQDTWEDMIDVFDGDGVEEESDKVVNAVLDELGVSLNQTFDSAGPVPTAAAPVRAPAAAAPQTVYQFPSAVANPAPGHA